MHHHGRMATLNTPDQAAEDGDEHRRSDSLDRLHRLRSAEEVLAVSRRMLDRLIERGDLDVVYVGAHRRITESSIQRYLTQHRHP